MVWLTLLASAGLALGAPAMAMADSARFNIAPQPLPQALKAFAAQAHMQLLYEYGAVAHVNGNAVVGDFDKHAALEQLLRNSGLEAVYSSDSAATIRRVGATPATSPAQGAEESQDSPTGSSLQLAQANPGQAQSTASVEGQNEENSNGKERPLQELNKGMPEVLIKGSRVLNMDIQRTRDDVQPYVTFDRSVIEESGASNINDFLREELSMDSAVVSNSGQPGPAGDHSVVNLRGFGDQQTLILVDGHRVASSSVGGELSQADINGIPISAIERIEILPVTASGIYGGSATGGVINIVLRRDYQGFETRATYGGTFDGGSPQRRIDLSSGFSLNDHKTSVLLTGSYLDSGELLARDRDFLQNGRAELLQNNPAFFYGNPIPPLGATTNITTVSGGDLILKSGASLNSPFAYVPSGYAGASTDGGAAFLATAGRYNLALASTAQSPGGAYAALWNGPTVASLRATVRQEITDRLQGFVELAGSDDKGRFQTNSTSSSYTIPAAAPNNPFSEDIQVTTPAFGADQSVDTTRRNIRGVAGIIFALSESWRAEADYTFDRTRFTYSVPIGTTGMEASAVASGSIDVLRDTNIYPVSFSQYLASGIVQTPLLTTLQDATARVGGTALSLPAGPLSLTTLLEHRKESIADSSVSIAAFDYFQQNPSRYQTVDSAYLELQIPVVSPLNSRPGIRALDFQIAGRTDHYQTVGSNQPTNFGPTDVVRATNRFTSTDPTLGLRFKPVGDVMLRASYATGFVPPGVDQIVSGPPEVTSGALSGVTDPRRGNEPLGTFTQLTGGNPGLKPEKSTGWSAGLVLTPSVTAGSRLSIDWSRIQKTQNIEPLISAFGSSLQAVINSEASIPGRITRAPAAPGDPFGVGPITVIDLTDINLARTTTEAIDISLDYKSLPMRFGSVSLFATGTRNLKFDTQLAAGDPVVEDLGLSYVLRWKGTIGATWDYRTLSAGWRASYYDSYWINTAHTVDINQGSAKVPNQIYHNLFIRLAAPSGYQVEPLSGTELQLAINNVFNHRPPFVADPTFAGGNLYSVLGDPRLATYSLSLRKSF